MQALYYLVLGPLLRFFCTPSTGISGGDSKTVSELLSFIPPFVPPLCGVRKQYKLKYLQLGQDPAHTPELISLGTLAEFSLPLTKFG